MQLSALIDGLLLKQVIGGRTDIEVTGIKTDSRSVMPGDLFICLEGLLDDGHRFAVDAVTRGAAALIVQKDLSEWPPGTTTVKVPDSRRAMALLANRFYYHPSQDLRLVGVTGTNGKTTTTHLIEKILTDAGKRAGLIGTLYMKLGDHYEKTINTTPEAIELQRFLRYFLDNGAEYGIMEVSSHALAMGRVRGCHFNTAIFTNLSHDHLDYHQTMEAYAFTKANLFSQLGHSYAAPNFAVLNADDSTSEFISGHTSAQVVTYGISNPAAVRATKLRFGREGISFIAETFRGAFPVYLSQHGIFNVYNALAAITAALLEDISVTQIQASLEAFRGVNGRFQYIREGQDYSVIVDYAHNPDGLENVLKTARELTLGRLICVVGCEGDRDRAKRPIMARIAAQYSDNVILTSDNPRSEAPEIIIQEMVEGLEKASDPERIIKIVDRRKAIENALNDHLTSQDCILIVGKGHEQVQIWNNRSIPFDDVQVATDLIRNQIAPLQM